MTVRCLLGVSGLLAQSRAERDGYMYDRNSEYHTVLYSYRTVYIPVYCILPVYCLFVRNISYVAFLFLAVQKRREIMIPASTGGKACPKKLTRRRKCRKLPCPTDARYWYSDPLQ